MHSVFIWKRYDYFEACNLVVNGSLPVARLSEPDNLSYNMMESCYRTPKQVVDQSDSGCILSDDRSHSPKSFLGGLYGYFLQMKTITWSFFQKKSGGKRACNPEALRIVKMQKTCLGNCCSQAGSRDRVKKYNPQGSHYHHDVYMPQTVYLSSKVSIQS